MKMEILYPSTPLQRYIRCYWTLESCSQDHTELVYPMGDIQLLFHHGTPFQNILGNGSAELQPRAFVSGQSTGHSFVRAGSSCGAFGIVLYPQAARLLLEIPLCEITGLSVEAGDVIRGGTTLARRLGECGDARERVLIAEDFLLRALAGRGPGRNFRLVEQCLGALHESGANVSPDTFADLSGLSVRQLERIFLDHAGLSPKTMIDLARFHRAVSLLSTPLSLTSVAHEAGFYDQSHCIREFRRFTGMTPGEFRSASCPS